MGTNYAQRSAAERATLMVMAPEGQRLRAMARTRHRRPSTISRAWRRQETAADAAGPRGYDAKQAGQAARRRRCKPRRVGKLAVDAVLFGVVQHCLQEGWSPGQMAGTLKRRWPDSLDLRVSAETISTGRYARPRGAWRQELIAGLRQAHRARLPRARGPDRRGQLADRLSMHGRPPAVEDRAWPGHGEGDFIKGAGNRAAVGVLVERRSRRVLLAKRDDATAASALAGYSRKLKSIAAPRRQSLTYDQGQERWRAMPN